jgi:hypothetical protein
MSLERYMNMNKRLTMLFLLGPLLLFSHAAKADSIALTSHVNNTYTYDLVLDSTSTDFLFDGFMMTGMSGLTDAYLSGSLDDDFGLSFDSTSIDVGTGFATLANGTSPYSVGTLTLISRADPGPVAFTILDSNGYFTGDVAGPAVAPVPEPSSILLIATGMFGMAAKARRRLSITRSPIG